MPRALRAALALAAALAAAPGCAAPWQPTGTAPTPTELAEARRVLEEAVARRPDLRLDEGGLRVDAYFHEWREVDLLEDYYDYDLVKDGTMSMGPQVLRDRVLVGPRTVFVGPETLLRVGVQRYPFGAAVELHLAGEPQPALLRAADVEEARRLASALDALRWAGGPAPGTPGAGPAVP